MNITFKSKKLCKNCTSTKNRVKQYGTKRANKIKQRLDDLYTAQNLEEVRYLPGHYHELTANRKGQWACDLDHPYRLIFIPHENPIPTDENGCYIWIEILGVEILEIANYHKK